MWASVLASGSSGNATWVESGSEAVLVDCGLSVPELKRRLAAIGRTIESLTAVLVTHDHGDHVGSSVALSRKLGLPLYATAGTHSVVQRLPDELRRVVKAGDSLVLGAFTARVVHVPHDGRESVCYRLDHVASGRSLGIVTDLGYVPRSVVDAFAGVQGLVVELNHDERMLIDGPYPEMLKRRIRAPTGHLSNAQGAELAAALVHDGLRNVVLAHLSETNNTPDLARAAFESANHHAPATMSLSIGEPRRPLAPFEV